MYLESESYRIGGLLSGRFNPLKRDAGTGASFAGLYRAKKLWPRLARD
jgi:hypothetical protein